MVCWIQNPHNHYKNIICDNYFQRSLFLLSPQYISISKKFKRNRFILWPNCKPYLHLLGILTLELLLPYHLSRHLRSSSRDVGLAFKKLRWMRCGKSNLVLNGLQLSWALVGARVGNGISKANLTDTQSDLGPPWALSLMQFRILSTEWLCHWKRVPGGRSHL